jgi:hypothetical protein
MFSIEMGNSNIFGGVGWLRTLGPITMDFLELYTIFYKDQNSYMHEGLKVGIPKIINSFHMESLLKKGHYRIIAQFHVIQAFVYASHLIHIGL